jgi:hypothetical protein
MKFHIPEEWNPQLHSFKNFKISILDISALYAVGDGGTLAKLNVKRFTFEKDLHKRGSNNDN